MAPPTHHYIHPQQPLQCRRCIALVQRVKHGADKLVAGIQKQGICTWWRKGGGRGVGGRAPCLAVNGIWASYPCCVDVSEWKSPFSPPSLQCRDWRQVDNDLAQPTCGCPTPLLPAPLRACLHPNLLPSSPLQPLHAPHSTLAPPPHSPSCHSTLASSHSTPSSSPHLGPWLGRSRSRWRCARSRRSNARQHPPRRSSTHCLHSAPGCGCARHSAGDGWNGLWREHTPGGGEAEGGVGSREGKGPACPPGYRPLQLSRSFRGRGVEGVRGHGPGLRFRIRMGAAGMIMY